MSLSLINGHVAHDSEGRAQVYWSLVQPEEASPSVQTRPLDRLIDRSPDALWLQRVRDESLKRAALKQFRALVNAEFAEDDA